MLRNNLLKRAQRLIPSEPVVIKKFQGFTQDDYGNNILSFSDVPISNANIIAIPSELYAQLGLDFQKEYKKVFVSYQLNGLDRQESPDKLEFYNATWTVSKSNSWSEYDGWSYAVVVREQESV